MAYDFRKIEAKWRKVWAREGIYEPDVQKARRPFFNLMMFPYPSAEGLHIGGVRTFTGVDIYGRFKRMQGYDVFEPIGLDGFGIHSENYALKAGKHPFVHAKESERNFYRQLNYIGNGFAWRERLETYDPHYYRWTQWIFTEMFRRGLAYRRKQAVNWCPSCKTVLADEQVIGGECERCSSRVTKKELEQWFFRITAYAERLLRNLEKLDWSEVVKTAQRNWIGRSEGAELAFEVRSKEKPNFVLVHGYGGSPRRGFFPWLKGELEKRGYRVQTPLLPHTDKSKVNEQDDMLALWRQTKFDENTVLLGHSLGSVVAMKAVEKLKQPIRRLILVGGFLKPRFGDRPRPFEKTFSWKFDFSKIKRRAADIRILHDQNDEIVPLARAKELALALGVEPILFAAEGMHACGRREPAVLENCLDIVKVFTTRPDTLFGATYLVLAPEHPLVTSLLKIKNQNTKLRNVNEVRRYVEKAKEKSEAERMAEGREKTGVELKGIKAINPATRKEIPVWVADYVVAGYGTGAIMGVPAHDERDWEFAEKYKLPAVMVICPNYPEKTCPVLKAAYTGDGWLVASGKFSGMKSEKAKWAITKFVGGKKQVQYKLRDWLISRQRYWGPPIPMIYCSACADVGRGERRDMPGWYAVPAKSLPVKLPYVEDFRPRGSGKSPLAAVKSFYEVKCPACGGLARRETDVSDTFLDSSWYYIGYLMKFGNWRWEFGEPQFDRIVRKWLPVHSYIGGAEHSVLHLLYSRFLAMAMKDAGYLKFEEPFSRFRAHGLITKDGAKMSKSRGNIVNPDEYFAKFGADAMRMYLAFIAPLTQGGDFRDEGIAGITRFLNRVWKLGKVMTVASRPAQSSRRILYALHRAIKKVGEDIEELRYNTAISALMVLEGEMEAAPAEVSLTAWLDFLKLLAPFAPFMAEELYQTAIGSGGTASFNRFESIHQQRWPKYNPAVLETETVKIVVQVNGKVRDRLEVKRNAGEEEVKHAAFQSEKVRRVAGDKRPKRVVYVPGRLINLVYEL